MITTTIPCLRDPFIVVEENAYYAYGTGWHCYKNSGDDLAGPWEDLGLGAGPHPQFSISGGSLPLLPSLGQGGQRKPLRPLLSSLLQMGVGACPVLPEI